MKTLSANKNYSCALKPMNPLNRLLKSPVCNTLRRIMKGNRFTITTLCLPLLLSGSDPVHFTDVTAQAGIKFTHNAGRSGKKWLPETMGPGCAFFDADGDGWLDILIINGKDLIPKGRRTTAALYRNNHDGTFTDITKGSGLDIDIFGIGVSIADYDNDGREDVYITALGGDHLFHNEGNGHFKDVTRDSGLANSAFAASDVLFDYDRDGKLDLF